MKIFYFEDAGSIQQLPIITQLDIIINMFHQNDLLPTAVETNPGGRRLVADHIALTHDEYLRFLDAVKPGMPYRDYLVETEDAVYYKTVQITVEKNLPCKNRA